MKSSTLAIIAATLFMPLLRAHAGPPNPPVSLTFTVAPGAKIHIADRQIASLTDLKVGDKVAIAYQNINGTMTAEKIHLVVPPPPNAGPHQAPEVPDPLLHAHGVVTAINPSAGTITAEVRIAPAKP